MDKNATQVPVLFQTLKNYNIEDTRFSKVKIWLMHLGENLNGSVFNESVVSKAIPTLSYTPIMGLLNPDTKDFEGHEISLVEDEEGNLAPVSRTVPYGVIPSDNNAQFEDRVGDDGITRTYLTVEGLLWNKWGDAVKAITSKNGLTGQSMEITDYSGDFNQDNFYEFNEFKFNGACLLGDAIVPAMQNSTVELAFSHKTSENIIQEKLAIFAKSIEEGGDSLNKKKEEFDKKKTTDAPENKEETKSEETATDVKETEEVKAEDTTKEAPKEETKSDTEEVKEEPKEESKTEAKEKADSEEEAQEETPEATDKVLVVEETPEAISVAREGATEIEPPITRILVGDKTYSVEEAQSLIEDYFALRQELHNEKIDSLFEIHAGNLTDEEVSQIKETAYSDSVETVENKIYAIIGRKAYSSKQEKPVQNNFSTVKVSNKDEAVTNEPYGGILNKYKK